MPMFVGAYAFGDQDIAVDNGPIANTYAVLRELERLNVIARKTIVRDVPAVLDAPNPVGHYRLGSRKTLEGAGAPAAAPADLTFLFDAPDRLSRRRGVDGPGNQIYLNRVIAPSIADLIVALTDSDLGNVFAGVANNFVATFLSRIPGDPDSSGHFPYLSAGIRSYIFPERDVRKSAGHRLLTEIFADQLLHPNSRATRSQTLAALISENPPDETIPKASSTLTVEGLKDVAGLDPLAFTDQQFVKDRVTTQINNNPVVQKVVISSTGGKLEIKDDGFWGPIFRGSNPTIRNVMRLIGLPREIKLPQEQFDARAEQLEQKYDTSIEQLDRCETVRAINDWRKSNYGSDDTDGLWTRWVKEDLTVQGHDRDFVKLFQEITKAILNDDFPAASRAKQRIPYRLEYCRYVLARLHFHAAGVFVGAGGDASLVTVLFDKFSAEEAKKFKSVDKLASEAANGNKFGEYQKRCIEHAKIKKHLVGLTILQVVGEALLKALDIVDQAITTKIQLYLDLQRYLEGKRGTHETNRLEKEKIPVRKYLVNREDAERRQTANYFKSAFENGLYEANKAAAFDIFLKNEKWEWNSNNLFMECSFGFPDGDDPRLNPNDINERAQLVLQIGERAIQWACTRQGNFDRQSWGAENDPGAQPPFAELAIPSKVSVTDRLEALYPLNRVETLANEMISEANIAALFPLKGWNFSDGNRCRDVLVWGMQEPGDSQFMTMLTNELSNREGSRLTRFHNFMVTSPRLENKRFIVSAELAVGFDLSYSLRKDA
ncbi:MAG: hypothetical protein ACOYLH_12680, partial [Flavobacteriales bacterium]